MLTDFLARLCGISILGALITGCGARQVDVAPRAPNPNGCYALIFDQPAFRGTGDVINGPARWSILTGIPEAQQATWDDRIRSLRIGAAAILTVYAEREFKGKAREFTAGTALPQMDSALSSTIKSLALVCQ
jgi:hypothetical protein